MNAATGPGALRKYGSLVNGRFVSVGPTVRVHLVQPLEEEVPADRQPQRKEEEDAERPPFVMVATISASTVPARPA